MGYETSKFGDGTNSTIDVHNHYGPRSTGRTAGEYNTAGVGNEVAVQITGAMLAADDKPLVAPIIPAGSVITAVYAHVSEAFDLAAQAVNVGTLDSEADNGVGVNVASAEAVGVYDITSTLAGTWAAPLLDATSVGVLHSGAVSDATVGQMKVVIKYERITSDTK